MYNDKFLFEFTWNTHLQLSKMGIEKGQVKMIKRIITVRWNYVTNS